MNTKFVWRLATCVLMVVFLCGRSFGNSCTVAVNLSPQTPPNFTIAGGGGSAQFIVNTGGISGFSCHWSLTENTFIHSSPLNGGGGSQFQFTVNFSVDPNPDFVTRTGSIKVTQTEDQSSSSETIQQNPATGDFAIAAAPGSQNVAPVNGTSYNLTIGRSGQFTGCVTLSSSGQPAGVGVSFSSNPVCGSTATMNVTTTGSACAGTFPIIISGTNGSVTRSTSVELAIGGDFNINLASNSQAVVQGLSTSIPISISQFSGFTAPITLSASGQPSGVTVSFTPNNTQGNSTTMTITTTSTASLGTFPLSVSGSSGCITHAFTDTLSISPNWWEAIQQLLD